MKSKKRKGLKIMAVNTPEIAHIKAINNFMISAMIRYFRR